jgi:hypothetical protein
VPQSVTLGLLDPFAHGRGWQDRIFGTSPAAGANFSFQVDSRWTARLIGITFTLVTDANVANRSATVDYSQPGRGVVHQDGPSVLQTASSTGVYNGVRGFGPSDWNTGTPAWFNLNGFWLPGSFTIGITVASIQTGDQLSAIVLTVERVSSGPDGYPLGEVTEDAYRAYRESFAT